MRCTTFRFHRQLTCMDLRADEKLCKLNEHCLQTQNCLSLGMVGKDAVRFESVMSILYT